MGLAAAALYLASVMEMEDGKTQSDIAKAAGVTEVTIRNRQKPLSAMEEVLTTHLEKLPDELRDCE